jgi:hypothetical protein
VADYNDPNFFRDPSLLENLQKVSEALHEIPGHRGNEVLTAFGEVRSYINSLHAMLIERETELLDIKNQINTLSEILRENSDAQRDIREMVQQLVEDIENRSSNNDF